MNNSISVRLCTAAAMFFTAGIAYADSACWPEAELIGTSAIGLYWAYSDQGDQIETFASAIPSQAKQTSCDEIVHGKECDSEYLFFPVWEVTEHDTLKIQLKNGSPAYVKVSKEHMEFKYHPVLKPDSSGGLNPRNTPILLLPNTGAQASETDMEKAKSFLSSYNVSEKGLTAIFSKSGERLFQDDYDVSEEIADVGLVHELISLIENSEGTWGKVEERLYRFIEGGPDFTTSEVIRSGYFLHRDHNGIIKAVLEDTWCD